MFRKGFDALAGQAPWIWFFCCPPRLYQGVPFVCYFPAMERFQRLPGCLRRALCPAGCFFPLPRFVTKPTFLHFCPGKSGKTRRGFFVPCRAGPHGYGFSVVRPGRSVGYLLLVTFQQWKVTKDCRGSPGPQGRGWGYSPHAPRCGRRLCWCAPIRTLGKCRRWSMDKQNAQRHLSPAGDSLGLSPIAPAMARLAAASRQDGWRT